MHSPFDEQRRAPRYAARVRVLYFSKGQPRAVDAVCENISADGLFVRTRRRGPATGTPVSLILSFEGAAEELMVEGVIQWQGELQPLDDGSHRAGMGIQFTEMNDGARASLQKNLAGLPSL